MKTVEDIKMTLAENNAYLSRFGVRHLWLFGSFARGEAAQDLDFMVEFENLPGLLNFMELKFWLEDLFQMPVDLVTKSSCPERFFRRISPDLKNVA